MTIPPDPPPLPSSLQAEATTTKLLFVWLEPQGTVTYTVRELAELLSLAGFGADRSHSLACAEAA